MKTLVYLSIILSLAIILTICINFSNSSLHNPYEFNNNNEVTELSIKDDAEVSDTSNSSVTSVSYIDHTESNEQWERVHQLEDSHDAVIPINDLEISGKFASTDTSTTVAAKHTLAETSMVLNDVSNKSEVPQAISKSVSLTTSSTTDTVVNISVKDPATNNSNNGLSQGALIGIIVACCVVGVAIIIGAVVGVVKYRERAREQKYKTISANAAASSILIQSPISAQSSGASDKTVLI